MEKKCRILGVVKEAVPLLALIVGVSLNHDHRTVISRTGSDAWAAYILSMWTKLPMGLGVSVLVLV